MLWAEGSVATVVAVRGVSGATSAVNRLSLSAQSGSAVRYTVEYDDTTPRPPPDGAAQRRRDNRKQHDAGHATLWDAAPVNAPALPDDAPRTIIRDSLYDTIPLGALELDLIGTPEFVRLAGHQAAWLLLSRLARRDPYPLRA